MKNLLKTTLPVLFFLLAYLPSQATHVMGGDIQWKCLGNDSFKVQVNIYRDCNGIHTSNTLIAFSGNCSGKTTTTQVKSLAIDITPRCENQCTRCSSSGCTLAYGIQKITFTRVVDVSGFKQQGCCFLNISWSQCCRNGVITNGGADDNFYIDAEMNVCQSICDNSPQFEFDPVVIVCLGQNIILSQRAIDSDRDSFGRSLDSHHYSFTAPLENLNYPIKLKSNYTYDKPFSYLGYPNNYTPNRFPFGLHLDPHTGDFMFRPMKLEQALVAIQIETYRQGKYISTTRRDMQIIVVKCPNNAPPVISGFDCVEPKYDNFILPVCIDTITCINICTSDKDTSDTVSLSYETNLPGAIVSYDSSQPKRPQLKLCWQTNYNLKGTGPYIFTVIATDNACPVVGITRRSFQFWVGDTTRYPINFKMNLQDSACGTYSLEAYSPDSIKQVEWEWYLHDTLKIRSTRSNTITDSFSHIFDSTGIYPIRIRTHRNGCWQEFYDTLKVNLTSPLTLSPITDTSVCIKPNALIYNLKRTFWGTSTNGVQGYEFYKDVSSRISGNKISFNYVQPIKNTIHYAVIDSAGCRLEQSFQFEVKDGVNIALLKDTSICDTLHDVKLPVYIEDTTFGNWTGSTGIDSNWLRAGKAGFGLHKLYYLFEKPNACIYDQTNITFNTIPQADLGKDHYYGCPNSPPVKINPVAPGGTLSGDTFALTSQMTFDPDSLAFGSYTIYYVKKSNNGCESADTLTYHYINYLPKLNLGNDRTACLTNNPVDFNPTPSGGILYSPYLNIKDQFLPNNAGLGKHPIFYSYTDSNGCSNIDSISINVINYRPFVSAGPDSSSCESTKPFVLNQGFPINGKWLGNLVYEQNDSQFFKTANAPKNRPYMLRYKYTDSVGCYNFDTAFYTIFDNPNAIAGKDKVHCYNSPDTITLSGSPTGGIWSGKGIISGNRIPISPSSFGSFTYYYQYTNKNGCSDIDSLTITTSPMPIVQVQTFDTVCVSGTKQYELIGLPKGGKWQGNRVKMHGQDSFYATLNDTLTGQYNYLYTYTDSIGCTTVDSLTLTVGAKVKASFTPSNRIGISPLTVHFLNNSEHANRSFWDFNDSRISSNDTPTHTYKDTGIYLVSLIASDSISGCSNYTSDTITVLSSWPEGIENLSKQISIYPNPASNQLFLMNGTSQTLQFELTDVNGKSLLHGSGNPGGNELNVSMLAAGVYLFKIRNANGSEINRRIIIK